MASLGKICCTCKSSTEQAILSVIVRRQNGGKDRQRGMIDEVTEKTISRIDIAFQQKMSDLFNYYKEPCVPYNITNAGLTVGRSGGMHGQRSLHLST